MRGAAVVMPAAPCFLFKTPKNTMSCAAARERAEAAKNPARRKARRIFNAIRESGSRRPGRAVARVALEEQGLAGDSRNHRRLERLRDQECRFRAAAGQEAIQVGGDEYHRHLENAQQLADVGGAGTAVGEPA